MLYVFYVDTGTTIKFEMEYLNKTVQDLKEAIERECGVNPNDQVLLMSGGCCLDKDTRVISYAGGTDGNPIFFFNIGAIKSKVQPPPILNYGSDVDLSNSFDSALALPVSLSTVSSRCKLAKHCYDLSREQYIICERLVQDQHHMHLGWTAAIANLDDISKNHLERIQTVYENISTCLNERQEHMQLIESFRADLQNLAKIPILPALESYVEDVPPSPEKSQQTQPQQQQSDSTSGAVSGTNISSDETPTPAKALSLLKWIVAKDSVSSLEEIADTCLRLLQQLDERILESLKTDMSTVEAISNDEMKDIKGLGDRLFALQGLLAQMKKLESDQHDLTSSLEQSKSRIKNVKDESVLPDLCSSHREHLGFMLQNYNQMRDIRRRCTKAKEELAANIHERLRWVAYVEDNMFNTENKLKMFYDNLRRLRQNLSTLRQIHLAPQMYMSAITEVVRRRTFSQAFLNWASNLACQLLTIHNEEVERRREFKSKFEGHFLNYLFPGLEDTPPPFATQAPSVFDNSLPKLTTEDMDSIREQFPDLAQSVTSPDMNSITQFFSRSITDSSSEGNKEKEIALMPIDGLAKERGIRPHLLSDRGGFESETDTEEFEKIGQAAMDSKQTSIDSMKQQPMQQSISRQKQLEESLNSTREEVERLRGLMNQLKSAACEHVAELRRQVGTCRQATLMERAEVARVIAAATEAVRVHAAELRQREQELTVDHELELSDLKKLLQSSEEQLQSARKSLEDRIGHEEEQDRLVATYRQKFEEERQQLQTVCRKYEERLEQVQLEKDASIKEISEASSLEIDNLRKTLGESDERIRLLEIDLEAVKTDHQKALKEETEKLQMEYKTQLETIRGRFKLMAASTMERSPSDSSLEKIERVDVIELVNHETILAQTKKDAELEKEEAVRAAVEHERGTLTRDLQIVKDTIKKRERDLELYRQRELSLLDECRVYKSTIEHLKGAELVIKNLESDKVALEHKVSLELGKSEQLEKMMHELELERDRLKQELEDERLKMSQTNIDLDESLRSLGDSEKDEVRVSESKKVKLEPDSDSLCMRTVEALEADNKRLSSELRVAKEGEEVLESKVEILQSEKSRLEIELVKERSKRNFSVESLHSSASDSSGDKEMSASVSVVHEISPLSKSRCDASTITEKSSRGASSSHSARDKLTKSTSSILPSGKVNAAISSCNTGDIVLVLWDADHQNFIVLQDSETFYFVNSDCLPDLGLKMVKDLEQPPKCHVLAEVVDKEYCSARKMENRYRVPQGTKFYRVRVKKYFKPSAVSKRC